MNDDASTEEGRRREIRQSMKDLEQNNAPGKALVDVRGLHHYTLSVAGLDETVAWYTRVLGFKPSCRSSTHPWGRVAYLQGPGLVLEILEVKDPQPVASYATGPEPDTDLTVCGHKHFALLHSSVDKAVAELEALGERVLSLKRVDLEGIGGFVAAFIADNNGGLIELPQDDSYSGESDCAERSTGESSPRPLRVSKLHHVALCVPDREEAVRWYSKVFGFSLATSFEIPSIGLRSAMMQAPGFWLELHCKTGSAAVPADRRDPRTDVQTRGNKYFALTVGDAAAAVELLEGARVDIVAEETPLGAACFFIRDNSGNPIELVQAVNS